MVARGMLLHVNSLACMCSLLINTMILQTIIATVTCIILADLSMAGLSLWITLTGTSLLRVIRSSNRC